ncbi:hypothetical protein ACFL39_01840 [Gemmatimonadota bacterium]
MDRTMQKAISISMAILMFSGCSPSEDIPPAMILSETRGDTLIVTNDGALAANTVFTLEYARAIGDPDDDPSRTFIQPHYASVDGDGNVHVLDRDETGPGYATRVVVFRANGRHLKTWGSEGRGPTDLGMNISINALPSGDVAIGGFHLTRVFDSDGRLQREWRTLATQSEGGWIPRGGPREVYYLEEDNITYIRTWRNPEPGSPRCSYAIALLQPGGALILEFATLEIEHAYFREGGFGMVMPWLPELVGTATQDGSVYWGETNKPEYNRYDVGTERFMRVILGLEPIPLTQSEIDETVRRKAALPGGRTSEDWFEWARGLPYPDFKPFYDSINVDVAGNVWLRESLGGWTEVPRFLEPRQFVQYHVINPEGIYLGRAMAPAVIIHISDSHVFSMEKEEKYGARQIVTYRLIPNN